MTVQFLLFRCGHVVYCLMHVLMWCMVFVSITIGGSYHKYHFCHGKNIFVMTNTSLSWQTHLCHDKHMFVAKTHVCCDKNACHAKHTKHVFVMTKLLSQQIIVATNIILLGQKFCCDKDTFVMTNVYLSWQNIFCCDRSMLVATKLCVTANICCDKNILQYLLWQKYFAATNICCDKHNFVTTSILLSLQKTCFVATKIILVAAPTNDSLFPVGWVLSGPLLQSLVHVSTAYANCDREQVAEQVYDPPLHPRKLIDAVEWVTHKEELVHYIVCHRIRVLCQGQLFHVH